jgi:hypothetical protein
MLSTCSRGKSLWLAGLILMGFAMSMDSAVASPSDANTNRKAWGWSKKSLGKTWSWSNQGKVFSWNSGNGAAVRPAAANKVPEVDIGSGGYALALLSGGLLFLGEKRRSTPRT